MNHLKNAAIKIVYIISLVFFYFAIFWGFSLHIEPYIIFAWFFVLFTFYYVMDLFNFEVSRYRAQDLILSFIFNFLNALFFYLFFRAEKLFIIFFILAVLENMTKFLLIRTVCRRENVLVYGANGKNEVVKNALLISEIYNYVGYVADIGICGEGRLAGTEKLLEIVKDHKVDKVVVLEDEIDKVLKSQLLKLRIKGVDIKDYFSFNEEVQGKIDVNSIDEGWLTFSHGFSIYRVGVQRKIKRVYDFLLAILIGILALPVMLLAMIIVRLESNGPVFFIQERIGYGGKPFNIIKFRSMRVDAEKDGPKWAEENDPRVTRFGKFMRKTRIDELPQLWNVIKGEMSFVGPRPERQVFVDTLEKEIPFYNLRHSVHPGLTGWAQVMYPYGASVEDALHKLEYELYYIKYQSFIMDVIIFFKTLKTIFFGNGR